MTIRQQKRNHEITSPRRLTYRNNPGHDTFSQFNKVTVSNVKCDCARSICHIFFILSTVSVFSSGLLSSREIFLILKPCSS